MIKIKKIFKGYLISVAVLAHVFVVWMAAGWPLGFDRWLIVNEIPRRADYIVCLGGGTVGDNIPSEDGWQRIYTAVQLWFDGYAPKIVFSGGGGGHISEAEVYAQSAEWFGCSKEAVVFEPGTAGTADHPRNLLGILEGGYDGPGAAEAGTTGGSAGASSGRPAITKDTRLIVVTSPLHSRRAALVFRKAGFKNFRMVTGWSARTTRDPAKVRALMGSRFEGFTPSGKDYGDIFNRLKWRTGRFFTALREYAAIAVYKIRGHA